MLLQDQGLPAGNKVIAACRNKCSDTSGVYVQLMATMIPRILENDAFTQKIAASVGVEKMLMRLLLIGRTQLLSSLSIRAIPWVGEKGGNGLLEFGR